MFQRVIKLDTSCCRLIIPCKPWVGSSLTTSGKWSDKVNAFIDRRSNLYHPSFLWHILIKLYPLSAVTDYNKMDDVYTQESNGTPANLTERRERGGKYGISLTLFFSLFIMMRPRMKLFLLRCQKQFSPYRLWSNWWKHMYCCMIQRLTGSRTFSMSLVCMWHCNCSDLGVFI